MIYCAWLLVAALAGWVAGKIAGHEGFGAGADVLFGVTGALIVRCSIEKFDVSLHDIYMLLFSIWGAASFPAVVRFGIRFRARSRSRSRHQVGDRQTQSS
jgi:uncharacterized membrane protein YeaQ/YmgE (transglycosylase-associated protein family)